MIGVGSLWVCCLVEITKIMYYQFGIGEFRGIANVGQTKLWSVCLKHLILNLSSPSPSPATQSEVENARGSMCLLELLSFGLINLDSWAIYSYVLLKM